ncbi:MAG TPA: T9SS type A sorting domain-containing protein [Bacteroidia bacterium]|nr:T9SS type A sorting domain-containing protein [Bacteroidia bacterium]HNU32119.1 T9SS type A sorting domain-containing protein [Bacteroidia bacterium]
MKRQTQRNLLFLLCLLFATMALMAQNPFTIRLTPFWGVGIAKRTPDNKFFFGGENNGVLSLIKVDSSGVIYSAKRYGYGTISMDCKARLVEKPDSGYYLIGCNDDPFSTHSGFGIIPIDLYGNISGLRNIFPANNNYSYPFKSISVNRNNGNYLVCGEELHENFNQQILFSQTSFVARFDSLHNNLYTKASDILNNPLNAIYFSNAQDLYFGNSYQTIVSGGTVILKLDSIGNVIWKKKYSVSTGSQSIIVQDDSSTIIFSKYLPSYTLAHKVDYYGNTIYCKEFDSLSIDHVEKADSAHLLIAGIRSGTKKIVLKTDLELNILNAYHINYSYTNLANPFLGAEIDTTDGSFITLYQSQPGNNTSYYEKLFLDSACNSIPIQIFANSLTVIDSIDSNLVGNWSINNFTGTVSSTNFSVQASNINCSPLVPIQSPSNEQVFTIYPNPNTGNLKLTGNFAKGNEIYLTELSGKIVFSYSVYQTLQEIKIETFSLSAGVYLLSIIGSQTSLKQKIIINY